MLCPSTPLQSPTEEAIRKPRRTLTAIYVVVLSLFYILYVGYFFIDLILYPSFAWIDSVGLSFITGMIICVSSAFYLVVIFLSALILRHRKKQEADNVLNQTDSFALQSGQPLSDLLFDDNKTQKTSSPPRVSTFIFFGWWCVLAVVILIFLGWFIVIVIGSFANKTTSFSDDVLNAFVWCSYLQTVTLMVLLPAGLIAFVIEKIRKPQTKTVDLATPNPGFVSI